MFSKLGIPQMFSYLDLEYLLFIDMIFDCLINS